MASAATKSATSALLRECLYTIFSERAASPRLAALNKLWHPSASFYGPNGHFKGHSEISEGISAMLHAPFPGFVFKEIAEPQVLPNIEGLGKDVSTEGQIIARLSWGYGPEGETPKATGEDVVIVEGGKVKTFFAFLDGKQSTAAS